MNVNASATYRVLVVDDDAAIRETYRQILQPKGSELGALEALISGVPAVNTNSAEFEVTLAAQGEQAAALQQAALAHGCPLQLAFIDMRMPPGWDGMQTAVALRAQDPSIYIVIATAFSDYDVNELQRALGHDVVMLRKPFTREEVYQLARTLCQSWQTRHRLEAVTAEMERQVQERTVELSKRIAQRQALADIATHCIELVADDDPDDAVYWSLARIGRVVGADVSSVFRLDASGTRYNMTHEWLALGMPSLSADMQALSENEFRLALGRLRRGETFSFAHLDDLRDDMPDAMGDLRRRLAGKIESLLSVPVENGGRLVGFVSIGCRSAGNRWDEHDETLLRTAGHIVFRTLEVHEAKQRLSDSEERYRSLVQSLPGAVYRCALDAEWTIQFMSDYIETLSGYPLGDFIDNRVRSYASIIYPDDLAMVDRVVREGVAAHAPYSLEYRIVHADATPRWVYERGQAAYGRQGEVLWLDGVITDISERKQAEDALRASEERFHRLFEDVDALAIQGYLVDGTVAYWNRASEKLYGYAAEEALGGNLFDLIIPPAMREEVRAAVSAMWASGQAIPAARLLLKHKNGSPVPVYSSHTVVKTPGHPTLLFCMDIDMSRLGEDSSGL